jgi:hypothetical protein
VGDGATGPVWFNGHVGQLTDPYSQGEDDEAEFTISGLPGELLEPDDDPLVAERAGGEATGGDAGTSRSGEGAGSGSADAPGSGDAPDDADEELVFELDHWSDLERGAVTDRLTEAGVPHWWVDAALHVSEVDRASVEAVLDTVDPADEPLDDDRDQVAYDMSDWDDDRLGTLADELDEAGLDSAWDGDELFVYADDEQAVDELIDKVSHPHELAPEPDDGEHGGALLGELFVAADRLQHDAEDHESTVRLLDLAKAVEKGEAPYGLADKDWAHLTERVQGLAELLRADKVDADAVLETAGDLRTSLRPYV